MIQIKSVSAKFNVFVCVCWFVLHYVLIDIFLPIGRWKLGRWSVTQLSIWTNFHRISVARCTIMNLITDFLKVFVEFGNFRFIAFRASHFPSRKKTFPAFPEKKIRFPGNLFNFLIVWHQCFVNFMSSFITDKIYFFGNHNWK